MTIQPKRRGDIMRRELFKAMQTTMFSHDDLTTAAAQLLLEANAQAVLYSPAGAIVGALLDRIQELEDTQNGDS